jgi:hypothetical protein
MANAFNITCRNIGTRKADDFYPTPFSMTESLFEIEKFKGVIYEPAAGKGHISVIANKYNPVISSEINLPPDDETNLFKQHNLKVFKRNFLINNSIMYDNIITNPPFKYALDFILQAKKICRFKIAMLLKTDFSHGIDRYFRLFCAEANKEFPLQTIAQFIRKPDLSRPLYKNTHYHTGQQAFSWFVWNKEYNGDVIFKWIDNNKFIYRKR